MFWDDLENFCLNLNAKQVSFIEQNHEQQEQSAEISIFLSNQSHKLMFANQEENKEATHQTQKHQGGF